LHLLVELNIVRNNVRLLINTVKEYTLRTRRHQLNDSNVEIIAMSDIYKCLQHLLCIGNTRPRKHELLQIMDRFI
jgi:hypothetical protein